MPQPEAVPAVRDFIALSLLPVWCWREVAEELRAGVAAGTVLERTLDRHWAGDGGKRAVLSERADAALKRALDQHIELLTWTDPRYPAPLAVIDDPPPVLWVRGTCEGFRAPAVALVGSRAGSAYALAIAERLAADLAVCGVAVVSGLARGIDSAAHRGALIARGTTIAVLGSGVDVVYPPEHVDLAREIANAGGAVVSEFPPGTPPGKRCFPQRNRVISGLSRAVVIVEAGERSGSLITARAALEQGRDVLAVPGNVLSGRNRGAHALLRDGAKIVETADDILEELGMAPGLSVRGAQSTPSDPVLASLTPGDPCEVGVVAERSGLMPSEALARLLDLELQGRVARVGGGRFIRFDRPC